MCNPSTIPKPATLSLPSSRYTIALCVDGTGISILPPFIKSKVTELTIVCDGIGPFTPSTSPENTFPFTFPSSLFMVGASSALSGKYAGISILFFAGVFIHNWMISCRPPISCMSWGGRSLWSMPMPAFIHWAPPA